MELRFLHSNLVRLGIAILICPIVDLLLWHRIPSTATDTSSWIDSLILAPGTLLGLLLAGAHSGSWYWIVLWSTTSILIISISYYLLALAIRFVAGKSNS